MVIPEVLQNMNEWCVEHHNASGLTDRVRASSVSIEEADRRLHQFVAKYVKPKTAPMLPPKRLKHRGLEDIQDTLEEFKFYKRHFLHTAASLVEFPSAVPYC
ncbi:probable oligoribonuclease [Diaphorina citri]|uniref:Probable oligoribonuclease n=1 Tax=Diaphorina citri TaxID=121845 RepID=A0A3Q0J0U5_DIACI|nr:probable oligoribonuclease [Diaphorina citri]